MIAPIRSLLFVPGTRQDRFAKAMNAGADAVAFDLEDSVEASQKERARTLIAEFLTQPASGGTLRLVRFNAVESLVGQADVAFFRGVTGFDGILLPKVETPAVLEVVGYDPAEWQGFAWGLGIDRIAFNLHGMPDLRLFWENDIRFLRQF